MGRPGDAPRRPNPLQDIGCTPELSGRWQARSALRSKGMLTQNEQAQKQILGSAETDMAVLDWFALKVHSYRWQDEPSSLTVYSDSDWAGCRESRKSRSGACFLHGNHLIKAYSKTQANIALCSAEAEYYSTVKAASEGLGIKAMTEDYLKPLSPWMYVDAAAAIGVAQRVGLGKLRHLDMQSLWL